MANILYIGNADINMKRGHGLMLKMHHKIICENIPNANVFSIFTEGEYRLDKRNKTLYYPNSGKLNKLVSLIFGYPIYFSYKLEKLILKIIKDNNIEIVYIDTCTCGKILKIIKNRFPSVKTISYYPDIEKVREGNDLKKASYVQKLAIYADIRNEKITSQYSDCSIVLNKRDEKLFYENYGKTPEAIIPIVVPIVSNADKSVTHKANTKIELLFVGANYTPNVLGLEWFINEVLPLIHFDASLTIVGLEMEKYRDKWEKKDHRVQVVGTVADLSPFYSSADVIIAPISNGGGMKVKTAEAFSYGKNFVGMPESLEGYWEDVPLKFRNKKIFKCKDKNEFVSSLNYLAGQNFNKYNTDIAEWMEAHYSYGAVSAKYRKVFNESEGLLR